MQILKLFNLLKCEAYKKCRTFILFLRGSINLNHFYESDFKLIAIGILGGVVLILVLKLVLLTTGNTAYYLLFNFDYIPVIQDLKPVWLFGYLFHFVTCIASVIGLFYMANTYQKNILLYVLVYAIGGGGLFFLTALSEQPPAANDWQAWIFWTIAHAIFGYVVGALVKKWF